MAPVVAIVGRPNVGKSTFFNKMVGARISIEEDTPGVTRDRVYGRANWLGQNFTLIDTGGLDPKSEDLLLSEIRNQAETAIEVADVIVFMVDAKAGLTHDDKEIALILRRARKPVLLVVNKIDNFKDENLSYDFYELGFPTIGISSVNMLNFGDLLDQILELIPAEKFEEEDEDIIKMAIVGKPNVGKSSLVNALLGEERVIVSNIPGTTREAIETTFEKDGTRFLLTDTAGIRRRKNINENIEHYSVLRSFGAIERSDITILMVDAQEGFTEQDKKIIGFAHDEGKAIIVLVNKWDLIEKDNKTYNQWKNNFHIEFPFLKYAPVELISVTRKERLQRILPMVEHVYENAHRRITTGQLNELINEVVLLHPMPQDKGKSLKIYYATQSQVSPPTFVLFINQEKLMHFSYLRYLENRIRENFDFEGTPIRFILKEKRGDK
ncbi:MAG: ribosome biogenesis GTPase Der [Tissierellia bacterium]|nr:ribosome biogenesis GTPase Der [Tissierellia bacterium]